MIKYVLGMFDENMPTYVVYNPEKHTVYTTHILEEATKFPQKIHIMQGSPFNWLPYFDPSNLYEEE